MEGLETHTVFESTVIGSILARGDPNILSICSEYVTPEMFREPILGSLFSLCADYIGQGISGHPLIVRVLNDIQTHPHLAELGVTGPKFISILIRQAQPQVVVEHDAIMMRYGWLREKRLMAIEREDDEEAERLSSEMHDILDISKNRKRNRLSIRDAVEVVADAVNDVYMNGFDDKASSFCGSGLLQDKIGGFRRRRYYVIGGRPGMGKTTVGLSLILMAARTKGVNSLVMSLEMGADELAERAVTDLLWRRGERSLEYKYVSTRRLTDREVEDVMRARSFFDSLPIVIDDRPGLTVASIRSAALREKARLEAMGKTLDVLMIDHLGLIKAGGRYNGNKVAETEEISGQLKALAKELDIAVVALLQLSRGVEGREDRRPQLSDLRWSGAIEQDADVVMFVYREAYYLSTRRGEDDADEIDRQDRLRIVQNDLDLIVAKNRSGETGTVQLFCDIGCGVVRDDKEERR